LSITTSLRMPMVVRHTPTIPADTDKTAVLTSVLTAGETQSATSDVCDGAAFGPPGEGKATIGGSYRSAEDSLIVPGTSGIQQVPAVETVGTGISDWCQRRTLKCLWHCRMNPLTGKERSRVKCESEDGNSKGLTKTQAG
jgi:hypothetical protein